MERPDKPTGENKVTDICQFITTYRFYFIAAFMTYSRANSY